MPGPVFLAGDAVALHPIEEDDLEFTQRYSNDPRIRHGLTTSEPQNAYETQQRHEQHSDTDDGVGLLVVPDGTDEPVGIIVLFDIDDTHGTGELACWVVPDAQGNGYATEATALMVDHALGERRLHKVIARALVGNEASRGALESVGFVEEGVQRDEKYVDGRFRDVMRYSILTDEWGGV
ncbi:GNAT family N-acetyltransferase [Halorarius halobius]|uniref:GNAT family N-acetyltransferase n=1 Tax=Halorarius halobius TaxID=2962671 RepID=UPI0020CBE318|nr:GNAT family protein [Halorarius halobius]